jgi:coenzyme F420-reducing hydrogenase gamma subunit
MPLAPNNHYVKVARFHPHNKKSVTELGVSKGQLLAVHVVDPGISAQHSERKAQPLRRQVWVDLRVPGCPRLHSETVLKQQQQ